MSLTRREALGIAAGALAIGGCSRLGEQFTGPAAAVPRPEAKDEPNVRMLNRFGFGPRPADLAELRLQGRDAWFAAQLAPTGDEALSLHVALHRLEIFHFGPMELRDFGEETIVRQLQQAAILRATYSPWQLRERLVDFWSNHFNIFARKGLAAYRKPQDERTVVRENALSTFPAMLNASAKSTAMLVYLDQQNSHAGRPNENYARELMELHTLGVDGGYTQHDVMEVARCFTGWSEERRFLRPRGQFRFIPELHDNGAKRVLGYDIPAGGGQRDGEIVLEILAEHPATARFLARKMCRFFLGEEPGALVNSVASAYKSTGGSIPAMVKEIYGSPQFWDGPPTFKRPFDYVISALRALDAETNGGADLQRHIAAMGQPLYLWPMPDGYPDATEAWTGSLLARWNFAAALANGKIQGTSVRPDDLERRFAEAGLAPGLLASEPASETARDLVANLPTAEDPSTLIALTLCSPEFQWR